MFDTTDQMLRVEAMRYATNLPIQSPKELVEAAETIYQFLISKPREPQQ